MTDTEITTSSLTDSATAVVATHDTSLGAPTAAVSAKQAAAILQFLQRTQMQGAEMPAYVDIFNTLSGIAATVQNDGVAS